MRASMHGTLDRSTLKCAAPVSRAACSIQRAVLATAARRVGEECSITCTSSVQLVTLVTSFNASDFSH